MASIVPRNALQENKSNPKYKCGCQMHSTYAFYCQVQTLPVFLFHIQIKIHILFYVRSLCLAFPVTGTGSNVLGSCQWYSRSFFLPTLTVQKLIQLEPPDNTYQ